jgi:hypothetical protein
MAAVRKRGGARLLRAFKMVSGVEGQKRLRVLEACGNHVYMPEISKQQGVDDDRFVEYN